MVNWFFSIILVSLIMPICIALPPRKNNVHEFRSATWNTNGPHWTAVLTLINDYEVDVFAIQEAGSIRGILHQLSDPIGPVLPFCCGGFEIDPNTVGVQERSWHIGTKTFYVYYYDNLSNTKQNMAIITRQRADEVIIIPPEVTHTSVNAASENCQRRTFINRPVIGIRIANSVFFNVHPEPTRTRNEAPALITVVQNYIGEHYPKHTWLMMGDFNRTPEQLRPNLPVANRDQFIQIISSGQNTRSSGELDYSIVGGPVIHRSDVTSVVAGLLQIQGENPSDHKPVKFN